jgi:hypothetical protein
MKKHLKAWITVGLMLLSAQSSCAQDAAVPTDKEWFKTAFASIIGNIRSSLAAIDPNSAKDAIASDVLGYSLYLGSDVVKGELMQQLQVNRQDVQPGATSSSSGSTSLVSKGGTPSLLGFALEHGGLTQTTDGNTITFRGNVANSIKALLDTSYLGSYQLGQADPLVFYLSKLSFGVSFDTSANQSSNSSGFTPSSSSFSGASAKYEIINHRDPRDPSHWLQWRQLVSTRGVDASNALTQVKNLIQQKPGFTEWRDNARASIDTLPANPTEDQVVPVVQAAADSFKKAFGSASDVKAAISSAIQSLNSYLTARKQVLDKARTSSVFTAEYNFNRQLTTNSQNVAISQTNQQLPDLSNINLVWERGFVGVNAPELTFNAGVTLFSSSTSTKPSRGSVRDYRASLQLDVPLKEIQNIGQPTLSFSGQFLSLLEEPLGQAVMLNGVSIDRRGNMGVFQAKMSIPIKNSGVKIPISFTYASRTELLKERDVRGNIGITFDLDTLFSKSK